MTDFYETDFGFSRMTREQLDSLADRGGRIGSTSYSYAMPRASDPHDGYSMRIIGRRGMGNHGIGVLVGTTPETRQRIRAGRAAALAAEYNVSFDFADTIIGVGGYATEPACIRAIIAEWDSPAFASKAARDVCQETCRAFCAEWDVEMHGLSVPRFLDVIECCIRLNSAFAPRSRAGLQA